jgi:gluconokinase
MVIVLAGESGVERATLALTAAGRLQFELIAGDDLQPSATRRKMRSGSPLSAIDRAPWLEALASLVEDLLAAGVDAIVTCSPLDELEQQLLAREGVHIIGLGVLPTDSSESESVVAGSAANFAIDELLRSLRLFPDS